MKKVIRFASSTWEGVANLLWPRRCVLCSGSNPNSQFPDLCSLCAEELSWLEPPFCPTCGEHFVGEVSGAIPCANCRDQTFAFDFAIAPLKAGDAVRHLVHDFKYNKRLWLCRALAYLMAETLQGSRADPRLAEEKWVLVPVPLHHRRKRERSFNQSTELVRQLADITGLSWSEALRRTRYTSTQVRLNRKERQSNLKKAFSLSFWARALGSIQDKPILLIDDVLTTGSTANECSRVLLDAGAKRVVVLALARA